MEKNNKMKKKNIKAKTKTNKQTNKQKVIVQNKTS